MLTKADMGPFGVDVMEMLSELTETEMDDIIQQCSLDTPLQDLGIGFHPDPKKNVKCAVSVDEAQENERAFREGLETVFNLSIPASVQFKTVGDAIRFVNKKASNGSTAPATR